MGLSGQGRDLCLPGSWSALGTSPPQQPRGPRTLGLCASCLCVFSQLPLRPGIVPPGPHLALLPPACGPHSHLPFGQAVAGAPGLCLVGCRGVGAPQVIGERRGRQRGAGSPSPSSGTRGARTRSRVRLLEITPTQGRLRGEETQTEMHDSLKSRAGWAPVSLGSEFLERAGLQGQASRCPLPWAPPAFPHPRAPASERLPGQGVGTPGWRGAAGAAGLVAAPGRERRAEEKGEKEHERGERFPSGGPPRVPASRSAPPGPAHGLPPAFCAGACGGARGLGTLPAQPAFGREGPPASKHAHTHARTHTRARTHTCHRGRREPAGREAGSRAAAWRTDGRGAGERDGEREGWGLPAYPGSGRELNPSLLHRCPHLPLVPQRDSRSSEPQNGRPGCCPSPAPFQAPSLLRWTPKAAGNPYPQLVPLPMGSHLFCLPQREPLLKCQRLASSVLSVSAPRR